MDQEDTPCWVDSFTDFCGRFDDLFARASSRVDARIAGSARTQNELATFFAAAR